MTKHSPGVSPFHYLAHPHEAYRQGYSPLLGEATAGGKVFRAYGYYLPLPIVNRLPPLLQYFQILMDGSSAPRSGRRLLTTHEVPDLALSVLKRVERQVDYGGGVFVGSKEISPIAHLYVGTLHEQKCAIDKYGSVEDYLLQATAAFQEPCDCRPVTLLHEAANPVLGGFPGKSPNRLMAGAITLLSEIVQHAGPDCEEFFDLFTNDSGVSPDTVDPHLWKRARHQSFTEVRGVTSFRAATGLSNQSPKPHMPSHFQVRIEEIDGGFAAGQRLTAYNDIKMPVTDDEWKYRQYYHDYD